MKKIVVWAGSDLYTIIEVKEGSHEEMYDQVVKQVLPRMEDDFGRGAELKARNPQEYDISVDKVAVEP